MTNTNLPPVEKFLLSIKGLHRDGYLDLESVAIEVKKLSDEEAVTAYRAMKMIFAIEPDIFASIKSDIDDVLGLLKAQALHGGKFSPLGRDSEIIAQVNEYPELQILVVLGRTLADMFVFNEDTTFDVLRAEAIKHSPVARQRIAANIMSNPMTPIIMPAPLLDEIMSIISPE